MRKPLTALILTTTLLLAAGCAANKSSEREDAVVKQGNQSLQGGEWAFISVTLQKPRTIRVAYTSSGPAMDAYFVNEEGLQAWKAAAESKSPGGQFSYIKALSVPGLDGEQETEYLQMPQGTYYVILDNTPFGSASPADGTTAEASFTVKRQR